MWCDLLPRQIAMSEQSCIFLKSHLIPRRTNDCFGVESCRSWMTVSTLGGLLEALFIQGERSSEFG